ncbi:hypothetical protein [Nocardiopsis sp. NPDC006832]|uniref:hypothetical protein n=1 Tax=Nocardiopsis sp. NPDC006832 TaxID=3157188 RepID=UPI0033FACD52
MAVLAAIAVIAAALVFAETALVYIALGLGALSVLLLLGALLQGRFGADGRDTARTDGLGKSSVPAVPAAAPDPTWESGRSGSVPAPAEESVRDTPVPDARPWGEEPQEEPEFDVPRWETPTKGDWPEPVQAAQTPPPQDEPVEAPASAFAYRVPERDVATPTTEDDTVETTGPVDEEVEPSRSDAHLADPHETFESTDDMSEAGSDFESYATPEDLDAEAPEATEETIGASAAFTDLEPEPEVQDSTVADDEADEPTETVEDASVEPRETFDGTDPESDPGEDAAAAVRAESDEDEDKVDEAPETEELEAEDTAAPEDDTPRTDGDQTLEADDDASEADPATDEPAEDVQGVQGVQDAQTDEAESGEASPADEDAPDRIAAFERPRNGSAGDPEPEEDPALAYAAIFDESGPEDDRDTEDDRVHRDDEDDLDEADERAKDPSHTN